MLLKEDKLILAFDCETTGFVKKWSPLDEQPHIVQLGYIMGMYNGETVDIIDKFDIYIDPKSEIPEAVIKIHGIDNERVKGCPEFKDIAGEFFRNCLQADIIIGHNIAYDISMIDVESQRIWSDEAKRLWFMKVFQKKSICTMQASIKLCKLPFPTWRAGYKWPKLIELHNYLFGKDFENAHDAMGDITATLDCFIELHQRKEIVVL